MKKLAIVILNYNGEEMLKRFIPTLLNCSGDAEIVVADNASDDNSVATIQRCHPEVRIITLQKNWGLIAPRIIKTNKTGDRTIKAINDNIKSISLLKNLAYIF